ncbi:MAG TPA: RluA family pseudouridine synthase [Dehalococcoidia bacterium]|nr:RluA family pseudouridine synthase [Dehalococcoidia bacterium]
MEKTHRFTVGEPGSRLDTFISDRLPELSRTYIQKLIADGYITVNERTVKSSHRVVAGECIAITFPPPSPSTLAAEDIPLNIVYEDKDLLVIDKPAGLTVHPAPGSPDHTLVNALLARFADLPAGSDLMRPGIVHRLDKDTSGLMLVARNRGALNKLANQFKARSVTKTYLVLVKGHLSPESGFIDAPIGRDPHNRKRMAVVDGGRQARTEYRVKKYIGSCSLLEVRLETGRTHQIRVHLSAIGYPVVGDTTYGVKSQFLSRQFVHAYRLGFRLPSSGIYVEFESDLPPDLQQALENIT